MTDRIEEPTPADMVDVKRGDYVTYTDVVGNGYRAQVTKVVSQESGVVHLMVETDTGNRRVEFVDYDIEGKYHTWKDSN